LTSFVGIIVSSSSAIIYKRGVIWDPLDILKNFLDEGGSGNRAGVFFIATAFALAQLGTNIAANSVSAGTDMVRHLALSRLKNTNKIFMNRLLFSLATSISDAEATFVLLSA
jgi:cytosine/uracil/thiamine/allantoin permease